MYSNKLNNQLQDLTPEEKNYIRTALCDPNLVNPTGVPDEINEHTVVKKIVMEDTIDFGAYAGTGENQLDIIMYPFVREQLMTNALIQRECEFTPQNAKLKVGGVGIYVQRDNTSPFASNSGSFYSLPANGGTQGQTHSVSDEFLGGRMRVIGACVKVTSTGAEQFQSGIGVAYRQDFAPSEGDYLATTTVNRVYAAGATPALANYTRDVYRTDVYPMPPSSNEEIRNLRGTKILGKSTEGAYLIGDFPHEDVTVLNPVLRSVILDDGLASVTTQSADRVPQYDHQTVRDRYGWTSGPMAAADTDNRLAGTTTAYAQSVENIARRNYYTGGDITGIRFSGLNLQPPGPAVMRIQTTYYVEQIPTADDQNMMVIAKPSPRYSPAALKRMSDIKRSMDFAFVAADNGNGNITKLITNALSTKIKPNAFTKAFDKSGVSKAFKRAVFSKPAGTLAQAVPGLSAGIEAARYADAVHRGASQKQAFNKILKPQIRNEIIGAITGVHSDFYNMKPKPRPKAKGNNNNNNNNNNNRSGDAPAVGSRTLTNKDLPMNQSAKNRYDFLLLGQAGKKPGWFSTPEGRSYTRKAAMFNAQYPNVRLPAQVYAAIKQEERDRQSAGAITTRKGALYHA